MSKKWVLIAGLVVVMAVFGFLIFKGIENSASYYYTLAELNNSELDGKSVRVKGVLVKDSVTWEAELPRLSFRIGDGEHELAVVYAGVRPDNFEHSTELILEGKMVSGEFVASKLMLQCPSKYENASESGGE